jgi:hypothetical protein
VGQVDVDGGPELEIVRAIADDVNGVASLVDELYFEYPSTSTASTLAGRRTSAARTAAATPPMSTTPCT